eukprot:GHVS01044942.1.p1 GENE.GHVS01044942.1~~GHVS01044942.1.p1  ORF type:complete len:439 (-),score=114.14 GHVS01044942.1:36-1352(-)
MQEEIVKRKKDEARDGNMKKRKESPPHLRRSSRLSGGHAIDEEGQPQRRAGRTSAEPPSMNAGVSPEKGKRKKIEKEKDDASTGRADTTAQKAGRLRAPAKTSKNETRQNGRAEEEEQDVSSEELMAPRVFERNRVPKKNRFVAFSADFSAQDALGERQDDSDLDFIDDDPAPPPPRPPPPPLRRLRRGQKATDEEETVVVVVKASAVDHEETVVKASAVDVLMLGTDKEEAGEGVLNVRRRRLKGREAGDETNLFSSEEDEKGEQTLQWRKRRVVIDSSEDEKRHNHLRGDQLVKVAGEEEDAIVVRADSEEEEEDSEEEDSGAAMFIIDDDSEKAICNDDGSEGDLSQDDSTSQSSDDTDANAGGSALLMFKSQHNISVKRAFNRYVEYLVLCMMSPSLRFPFPTAKKSPFMKLPGKRCRVCQGVDHCRTMRECRI